MSTKEDTEPRPLNGIRVLDLSRLLPGPYSSLVLADLGADVIKIEAPGAGDYLRHMPPSKAGMSGAFWTLNRDKRSVELDLKSDSDRERFLNLVATADIVIESFRPGVIDRLGIGYQRLCQYNPTIILCSISGYGQTGPYRDRAGHDINYSGLAGVLAMGGTKGGAPMLPGVQIADLAGALWAVSGILAALFGRERNGHGAHLDISMTDGTMALLAAQLGYADCGGPPPTRGSELLNGGAACYGIYETSDGRYLSVGALEPKFWLAFNQAIGRKADTTELLAKVSQQDKIRTEIAEILLTKTRDQWVQTFSKVDCCCEPILELNELADHPLHRQRGRIFRQVIDPGQGLEVVAMQLPIGQAMASRPAPRQGQHSTQELQISVEKERFEF